MLLLRRFLLVLLATLLWRYNDDTTLIHTLTWILRIGPWCLLAWLGFLHLSGKLDWSFFKSPFRKRHSIHWACLLNIWICLILICVAQQIDTIKIQNTATEYAASIGQQRILASILALLAIVPPKKICLSCNLFLLALSCVLGYQVYLAYKVPTTEEAAVLKPPIHSSFAILSGGYSPLNSVLQTKQSQSRRFGVHLRPAEESFLPHPLTDEPFPAPFGEPIYSPASGTVVALQDALDDLPMGSPLPDTGPGNFLIIEIAPQRFLVLAHLQKGSVLPQVGDDVVAGQPIARIGKSGMVTEPLILILVFNKPELFDPDLRSFPILFDGVQSANAAGRIEDSLYFPTRNDFFVPASPTP